MRLKNEKQTIQVQLWADGAWRRNITGQVIGTYEGLVGVLTSAGEYLDVPEEKLRVIRRRRKCRG